MTAVGFQRASAQFYPFGRAISLQPCYFPTRFSRLPLAIDTASMSTGAHVSQRLRCLNLRLACGRLMDVHFARRMAATDCFAGFRLRIKLASKFRKHEFNERGQFWNGLSVPGVEQVHRQRGGAKSPPISQRAASSGDVLRKQHLRLHNDPKSCPYQRHSERGAHLVLEQMRRP